MPTNLETQAATHWIEQLGHPHWPTHETAYNALFAQGPTALDALIAGLSHPSWRVRMWCADLMDHLADDRCREPLRRALADPSPHVRRHAVHSLGCQRCKAAPLALDIIDLLIERALTDPSIRVRRVAVHQLGLQGADLRIVQTLHTILQEEADPKLVARARFALSAQSVTNQLCRTTEPSNRER